MNFKKILCCVVFCVSMLVVPMRADALIPLPTFDMSRIYQIFVKTSNQIMINSNKVISNRLQSLRNIEIGTGFDSWSKYSQLLDDAKNEYNRYGDMKKAILASITKNGREFAQQYATKVENKAKARIDAKIQALEKRQKKSIADAAASAALQKALESTKASMHDSVNNWYKSRQNPVSGAINAALKGAGDAATQEVIKGAEKVIDDKVKGAERVINDKVKGWGNSRTNPASGTQNDAPEGSGTN